MGFAIRSVLLGSVAALAIVDHNGVVEMVILNEVPGRPALRAERTRSRNALRTQVRNWKKPQRRWPGRLY